MTYNNVYYTSEEISFFFEEQLYDAFMMKLLF